MPKIFTLKIGDRNIASSELTYDDLIELFKQFIKKENRTPSMMELSVDNNLPSYSKVQNILKNKNINYKEFCSLLGDNKMLIVHGEYKQPKDITYDELVLLYEEYISKHNTAPTSITSNIDNNLPHRTIINSILKEKGITHNEFLSLFGLMDNRRKYKPIQINDMFGRWKVISKGESKKCGKNTVIFWLCECTCGSKIRNEISENALQTGNSKSCGCLQSESISKLKGSYRKKNFEEWCIENGHKDFLDRWDYDKNKLLPSEISYTSHEKVYFKCPCSKHESSLYQLSSLHNMKELRCKYCYSFAQRLIDLYGDDALEKYWDYDKNVYDPWLISGSSKNKVWIKCINTDYHGSYEMSRDNILHGLGCPYCNHSRIHPKDSFGQKMVDKYGVENFKKIWNVEKNIVDPFTIPPSTRKYKVWLNCIDVEYHPPSHVYPNDVNNHIAYCSYCAKTKLCKEDSLGYKFPNVFDVWSDKNEKTPYDYFPTSNVKLWWKCYCGKHKDFQRNLTDANAGEFGCPECNNEATTSKLQNKVSNYIESKYHYKILHENKCNLKPRNPKTNILLKYDNEIPDIKLIIEVNGQQHYEICGFTYMAANYYGTTAEEELENYKYRDKYKMDYAIKHGYSYLVVPYWTEKDESYKNLIDNKINEILKEVS